MSEPGVGEQSPPGEIDLSNLNVVVVEDHPVLLAVYKRNFDKFGIAAQARFAKSPADAEKMIEELQGRGQMPNVILSDFHLPKENGLEFLARMRKAHPELQAIIATSMPLDELQEKNVQNLQFDYVDKRNLNTQSLQKALGSAANRLRPQAKL